MRWRLLLYAENAVLVFVRFGVAGGDGGFGDGGVYSGWEGDPFSSGGGFCLPGMMVDYAFIQSFGLVSIAEQCVSRRLRRSIRFAEGVEHTKKVLVLGGTGRVGQSICRELQRRSAEEENCIDLYIAGRNEERGEELVVGQNEMSFCQIDIDDRKSLPSKVKGFDLVVHAAGPFQKKTKAEVLEACIEAGVRYQDVCDDVSHMKMAKALDGDAKAKGITAAVCTGIYPGVSNLMASKGISVLCTEPTSVDFSYFTA